MPRLMRHPGMPVALAGGIATFVTVGAADRPVEKSILVTVLEESGAPLRDLTVVDFSVREDGVVREVSQARLATDPLFIAVLIDTTKPLPGIQPPTQELRTSLATFVRTIHEASPEAQIQLIETAGAAVVTVNFTTKTADLDRNIRRLFPSQRSSAVLLEALVEAADGLSRKPSPRRAIVSVNFNSPEASTAQPARVGEAVRTSGASVWAVSVRGTESVSSFQTGNQAMENTLGSVREVLLDNAGGDRRPAPHGRDEHRARDAAQARRREPDVAVPGELHATRWGVGDCDRAARAPGRQGADGQLGEMTAEN